MFPKFSLNNWHDSFTAKSIKLTPGIGKEEAQQNKRLMKNHISRLLIKLKLSSLLNLLKNFFKKLVQNKDMFKDSQ